MSYIRAFKSAEIGRFLVIFVAVFVLTSCAVKLAPEYDKSIINGLAKANTETLTLFAGISDGAEKDTFSQREKAYNSIIGQFDALRVQVSARPTPRSLIAEWFGLGTPDVTTEGEIENIGLLKAPTADILQEIVNTLIRMRETDQKGTLSKQKMAGEGGFPNSYEISIRQALTYEKALER